MKRVLIFFLVIIALALSIAFYFIPAFSGDLMMARDISVGPVKIHLYGLTMAIAILVSFVIASTLAPKINLAAMAVEGALPWAVICGFCGARLYFVLFSWPYFQNHPWEILQVWRGGFSIYGAILGGIAGTIVYAKLKALSVAVLLDLVSVAVPVGQAIGRFGNFFNQEAFGRPTDLPWGLYISPQNRPLEFLTDKFFHPTFLYESLWDLVVFFILFFLFRNSRRPGTIFASYLILYSLGRFFIEDLRTDSFTAAGFRVDQVVALLVIIIGAALMFVKRKKYELENN